MASEDPKDQASQWLQDGASKRDVVFRISRNADQLKGDWLAAWEQLCASRMDPEAWLDRWLGEVQRNSDPA